MLVIALGIGDASGGLYDHRLHTMTGNISLEAVSTSTGFKDHKATAYEEKDVSDRPQRDSETIWPQSGR